MDAKISIIVPVYNTEKYVGETIELLANQTYKNLEIILVDNNSKDNSLEICRSYAQKDERILVLSETTPGPSAARNRGLDSATGDFICFCDSDDLPDKTMYGTLLQTITSSGSDIAMCEIYSEHRDWIIGFPYEDDTLLDRAGIVGDLIPKMIGNDKDYILEDPIWGSVVRCIYKSEIIKQNNIMFPVNIRFAEDLIFTMSYLKYANSVYICKKILYQYRKNEESIMHTLSQYEKGKFEKKKKKALYLKGLLEDIGNYELVETRALVAYKHYIVGSIANAVMNTGEHGFRDAYKEIKKIVNDDTVQEAFASFTCKSIKQNLLYKGIQKRAAALLCIYYRFRFLTTGELHD
jgi:glycosyltransferase involved in cell wall biosynthesis